MLAPDIIEAILSGSIDPGMMLEQLERSLPASWAEQRPQLLELLRLGHANSFSKPCRHDG